LAAWAMIALSIVVAWFLGIIVAYSIVAINPSDD
jgi:uncharacterized membrane protein YoaT (DUF817 family)